jgi:hypothetical protein
MKDDGFESRKSKVESRNSKFNFYALRITHYALRITHYALRIPHVHLTDLPLPSRFRSSGEVRDEIAHACAANPDIATVDDIGSSREGRIIYGVTLGNGPRLVTLIAGAHADEPVGPETLRTLILECLANRDWLAEDGGFTDLFERFTFRIIPQINPDGEARNRSWIEQWPSVEAYVGNRVREHPGDDIEFGYPVMRPENRAASSFLFDYTPISLHMSLHGMGLSEGALLLIDRHRADSVQDLKSGWREAVAAAELRLHDHDRSGEKGFHYYGPGFWSTPEGTAMRQHFRERGDHATASLFFHSSMEWARMCGYDPSSSRHPLCLVTELPLFVIDQEYEREPGVPAAYLELLRLLPEITERMRNGENGGAALEPFRIRPLPLGTAVRLHLRAIELGLLAA